MKIALGSDEKVPLLDTIQTFLQEKGCAISKFFPENDKTTLDFPDVAAAAAETVIEQSCDEAILLCWTGTGVSIAANKIPGIRAALCGDAETAKGARRWNKANVLCLSNRTTSTALAIEILTAWFANHYISNAKDDSCIAKLHDLEIKN